MGIGRRCDMGCATWPDEPIYRKCAICGGEAERCKNVTPMDDDEAQSLKLHHEFEVFYERRCASLNIPADGPLPDDYVVESRAPT